MDVYQQIKNSLTESPILVADDDEAIRFFVAAHLGEAGFKNISFAENGVEALAKISKIKPACVVLDIMMPVMDGNEVLKQVRANEATRDMPVLVVTSYDSHDERNNILRAGASNLISKPIDGEILNERVVNLVERALLFAQLKEFHSRLSFELSSAAQMQSDLIPTEETISRISKRYQIDLACHTRPSSELGGDYWALQEIDSHKLGVMIVDFSGHGVSAALNTFRLHTLMNKVALVESSPAAYVTKLNAELADVMPPGQYCTLLYAIIDLENNCLTYSGAAAPSPVIGSVTSSDLFVGDGSGLPVGIRAHASFEDHVIDFPPGSFLFLYSDALLETELDEGRELEIEGIVRLVKTHKTDAASTSLKLLLDDFYGRAPDPLPDDLTAIWVCR